MVTSTPQDSYLISNKIIGIFESYLPELHREDYSRGYYLSHNRKGEKEIFNLLSITFAIVSTENYKIESYAQLASIAAEITKKLKEEKSLWKVCCL